MYILHCSSCSAGFRRCYSTQAAQPRPKDTAKEAVEQQIGDQSRAAEAVSAATGDGDKQLSKKEQLKRAFKEYGATIVAFHVGISLISLGGFYLLVSR